MKKSSYLLIFIVIFFITALIINPTKYSLSILNGVNLFYYNIFPTLLPFMFFTKVLQNTNFSSIASKKLYKLINKLFHTTGYSSFVFIISLLCGYPLSNKILADLYEENKINKDEVLSICSFTTNSNPLFIIGVIGGILLKNTNFAILILISHYTSSLINGFIHSTLKIKNINNTIPNFVNNKKLDLYDNMLNTTTSMLVICGYITIFNFIIDVLIDYNFFSYISTLFENINTNINLPSNITYYNLIGLFEVTRGVKEITKLNLPNIILLPTICSMISFGGISILLQSYSFLQKTSIKFTSFLYIKITQAIIAYVICFLLCLAFDIN